MGLGLHQREPVFRAALEEFDRRVHERAGWSVLEVLAADEADSLLDRTQYAQPAIFAVQVALVRLWAEWGVAPSVVIGHSAGEVAAACVAGALDPDEAVRVIVQRGRVMEAAAGLGRMAAVALPEGRVREELGALDGRVGVAAVNSPVSTVVSGEPQMVEQLVRGWTGQGVAARMLPVDYAFHCVQMETIADALAARLGRVAARGHEIAILSTVAGDEVAGGDLQADYWRRNVRQPVLFRRAIGRALARGIRCFIEVGPHPVLHSAIAECAAETHDRVVAVAGLRRGADERSALLAAAGELYTLGHRLNWPAICGKSRRPVLLPAYPFERRRCWTASRPDSAGRSASEAGHPLLGLPLDSPALRGRVWQSEIAADHPMIRDHRISGSCMLPLAAYLEMALAAAGAGHALVEVTVSEPLPLPDKRVVAVQTVVEGDRFEIYSRAEATWKLHATGRLDRAAQAPPVLGAPPGLEPLDVAGFYERQARRGLEFGPDYRTIRYLEAASGEVRSSVFVGEASHVACRVEPALLDGCLQSVMAAVTGDDELYLPIGIDRLEVYRPGATSGLCRMRLQPASNAETLSADFEITSEAGSVIAAGSGLHIKRVRAARSTYEFRWESGPGVSAPRRRAGRCLVVGDPAGAAAALRLELSCLGAPSALIPAHAWPGDVEIAPEDRVVLLAADAVWDNGADPTGAASDACRMALAVIRRAAESAGEVWLVTRDAQRARQGDLCEGFAQATVWGFARTAALEYPDLRCVRVDLDGSGEAIGSLAAELLAPAGGDDLAFRGRDRYVARVVPVALPETGSRRLTIRTRGSIDHLEYGWVVRRNPLAGEVEVDVEASALNFRDVLNVLGALPGEPGPLGLEFCGRIARVGPDVQGLRPGDRVLGLAWGSFADAVVARAAAVVPVPEGLDLEGAVTLPNAFATAWHSLVVAGGVKRSDRVLIHSAASGVGLMAVQIARHLGATVFATAGSESKRDYLRSIGVERVFDSRALGFASEVLRATDGRGVDLVLNSLAGEFIPAGLSTVAQGGRFIEIGKTGIWDESRVAALGRGIRYTVVDLGPLLDRQPDVLRSYLNEMTRLLQDRAIHPLPRRVFGFEDAAAAFRYMAQARHTGKVVLRHSGAFRTEGTWLLSGGMGALGLEVARWLVDAGASRLILVGRSGPSADARAALVALRRRGVAVETLALDVGDARGLAEAVSGRPLTGIVHLAGLLDDGIIEHQSWDRFAPILRPKVEGAWNLHEIAGGESHFVLFSSAASFLGSPGQASYAAANAFLDGLAAYRAARGQPAVAVNWGAWAEKGMAASVMGRRTLGFIRPMSATECLAALGSVLASGRSQVAVLSADWGEWGAMAGCSRVALAIPAAAPGATSRPCRASRAS